MSEDRFKNDAEFEQNEQQLKLVNKLLSYQLNPAVTYSDSIEQLSKAKLNLLECRHILQEETNE